MMQKTYLSRAVTRAMAHDHPIGDPFGGPAYGERRDPISAIISIGTMVGTYGAAGTFAAMTLTQGLMFAGAAISLVGNVTGNKTLSKIGMITGLAGGVGALAETLTGQTIGGTLGETFGFGEAAKGAGANLAQSAAPGVQTPVVDGVQASPVADAGGGIIARELGPLGAESTAAASLNAPGAAAPSLNAPGGAASPLNSGSSLYDLAPGSVAPGGLRAGAGAGTGIQIGSGNGTALSSAGRATGPGFMDSIKAGNFMDAAKAAGSNVMDLAKSNPGAAMMMGNMASGVADWLSGKTDAEIAALEAQTGFADARALQIQEEIAKEKRRRANLNAGYQQVNTAMPVNPNATMQMPWQQQQPGLINGARG